MLTRIVDNFIIRQTDRQTDRQTRSFCALKIFSFFLFVFFLTPINVSAKYIYNGSLSGSITVPENNYCINNGFNKLSDCMLVMEKYSKSVDDAKSYIVSKGTPDFSKIAPSITYVDNIADVSNQNGIVSSTNWMYYGDSYSFNSATGLYSINTNLVKGFLSDDYIGKYTCASTNYSGCGTVYKIKAQSSTVSSTGTITYKITAAERHDGKVESLDSEIGLYSVSDGLGTSYYYRGAVKNNFVSFGGFVWKIVRQNGDGTVRMIYNGTSTSATGNNVTIGNAPINQSYYDPTYVGYKYSEDFEFNDGQTTTNKNSATVYSNMSQTATYYYADSYTKDDRTKKFKLAGNIVSKKWLDDYEEIKTSYPYTCFSTNSGSTCNFMLKISGKDGDNWPILTPISYSSKNYQATLNNTKDSYIKTTIDNWYKKNLLNSYSKYIADEVFCNDRSIGLGSGYLLSPTTNYSSYIRLVNNKKPSLSCKQESDKFSLSNPSAKLDYPVGLITADEVSLGGGVQGLPNSGYYLYTGGYYWTMSPSYFYSWVVGALAWDVSPSGSLDPWDYVTMWIGARPVINLKADVTISGGDGTALNPFVIETG